jgi:DNA-directed RNA polymerase subunit M/transcription elongation factor TFIIS
MRFCSHCHNMLYVKVDEDENLVYYCKFCQHTEIEEKTHGSVLVLDDNKVDDVIKYKQYINKHIIHDPTLPRVNNVECPSVDCTKSSDKANEVIYIKYDFVNMRYLYYCCHCGNFWRSANT